MVAFANLCVVDGLMILVMKDRCYFLPPFKAWRPAISVCSHTVGTRTWCFGEKRSSPICFPCHPTPNSIYHKEPHAQMHRYAARAPHSRRRFCRGAPPTK